MDNASSIIPESGEPSLLVSTIISTPPRKRNKNTLSISQSPLLLLHTQSPVKIGTPQRIETSPFRKKTFKRDVLSTLETGKRPRLLPVLPLKPIFPKSQTINNVKDKAEEIQKPPSIIKQTENHLQDLIDLNELLPSSTPIILEIENQIQLLSKNYVVDDILSETANELLALFKQFKLLFQKKIQVSEQLQISSDMDSPHVVYKKLCLECILYCFNMIHSNPGFKLLQQEDLYNSIALFLRNFVQDHFSNNTLSLFPSLLASIFSIILSILSKFNLPQSLLVMLDDVAWMYIRHQIPSNDLLYNEIIQFRVMLFNKFEELRKGMLLSLFEDIPDVIHLTPTRSSVSNSSFDQICSAVSSGNHEPLVVTRQLLYFLQYCMPLHKTMLVGVMNKSEKPSCYDKVASFFSLFFNYLVTKCISNDTEISNQHLQLLHGVYVDLLYLSLNPHYSFSLILLQLFNMAFMQKLKVIPSQTSQDFSKPVKAYIKTIIEMVTEYNLFCQMEIPSLPVIEEPVEEVMYLQIPGMEKEVLGCSCRDGVMKKGTFLIACDGCNQWYHGDCVGLTERPTAASSWRCPRCCQQGEEGLSGEWNDKEKEEMMILNYYSRSVTVDDTSSLLWEYARNSYLFILAETYANKTEKCKEYSNWLKQQVTVPSLNQLNQLIIHSASQIQLFYIHSIYHSFPLSFTPSFFALFLRGFDTPLVAVQNFFYNGVNRMVNQHPQLFLNQSVLLALKRGMISTYISVREKNMKLLLAATNQYPRLLTIYYSVIVKGIKDRGVSVRKVSSQLLYQLAKHLIHSNESLSNPDNLHTGEQVFQIAVESLMREEEKTVRGTDYEILNTCLSRGINDDHMFIYLTHICEFFLSRLNSLVNENKDKITSSAVLLHDLHDCLNSQEVRERIEWLLQAHYEKEPIPTITILTVYARIKPELLVSSIGSLQCLLEEQLSLQTGNKQTRQMLIVTAGNLIDLLKCVVPHGSLSPPMLMLKKCLIMTAKQATAVSLVERATECLVIICSSLYHDNTDLYTLLNESLALVSSSPTTIEGNEGVRFIAAVVIVGVLIRDIPLEASPPDDEIPPSQAIHNGNYTHLCETIGNLLLNEINRKREGKLKQVYFCQLLKAYLRLHSRAVDKLSEKFISLFGSMLKSNHSEIVQICTQAVVEFLENLPRMISQSNNSENKKLSELLYSVPQYSLLPSIVKEWKSGIQSNLTHSSHLIRFSTLRVLTLEVKQGLEYPVDCIEIVISLLLDPNGEIQRLALSLLDYINSNFHSVFIPRVAPAILQAIISQGNLEGIRGDSFCELYSLISSPYTSTSINECKDITDFIITAIYRNNEVDLFEIIYFTRFLSVCNYGCLEEVLNVIIQTNSILYLLINQSESYLIELIGGQDNYELHNYSVFVENEDSIMEDRRYCSSCLKIIRSILMILLKKHLKSLYQISSTTVALASLTVDNPGINKRDKTINGVDVKEINIPKVLLTIPSNSKELVKLVQLFQSLTFVDPVENAEGKKVSGKRQPRE